MSMQILFAMAASAAFSVVSTLAVAQFDPWNNNNVNLRAMTDHWSGPSRVGELASNEGIYVGARDFQNSQRYGKRRYVPTNQEFRGQRGNGGRNRVPRWRQALRRRRKASCGNQLSVQSEGASVVCLHLPPPLLSGAVRDHAGVR